MTQLLKSKKYSRRNMSVMDLHPSEQTRFYRAVISPPVDARWCCEVSRG